MTKKGATSLVQPRSVTHSPADIVGHSAQRKFFKKLFEKNIFPSTLLLAGPGGVGKGMVAEEIARALFCDKTEWSGCGTCHSCTLFQAQTIPDFYTIDFAAEDSGSVEHVRELLYSLQLKSFSGKNRVVIFSNAHLMSTQVTNALLKSLEEPRPNTYFILTTSSKARLLPTLLSRCQTSHFDTLSREEMLDIIKKTPEIIPAEIPAKEHELLITLADGSFENLQSIAQEFSQAKDISKRLDSIIDGAVPETVKLAGELARNKEHIGDPLRLLVVLMRAKLQENYATATYRRVAVGLQNCISAERYVLERNLAANYVLSLLLTQLLPPGRGQANVEPLLLENVLV